MLERRLCSIRQDPARTPAAWLAADSRQLNGEGAGAGWLDPRRLGEVPALPEAAALSGERVTGVNIRHPRWERALEFVTPRPGPKRVHILAVGDVGGVLLTALKLKGGGIISAIGIYDLNEKAVARWVMEMGQIACSPIHYDDLPEVEAVSSENLFDCDVFIFAAAKAIPPVGSGVRDVRMAQLEANRPLAESFARQAREADFRGLFAVLSDPVDPLCQAVWRASNIGPDGELDHLGLLPEQVQGFGLGVMSARAAYFAKRAPRFASFFTEGRAFGPHGQGLVIANSIRHYDDTLSRELTQLTLEANLRVRELGFKPYVAPAISSGALQLLLALEGEWHDSSVPLGGIWFGCRNRFTSYGLHLETLELPDALFARLQDTERALREIS